MPAAQEDVAAQADGLKAGYLGLSLALVPLLDPRLPLLDVQQRYYEMPADAPFEVKRKDGSMHSATSLQEVFRDAAALPHAGFRAGILNIGIIMGATSLGDALMQAQLMRTSEPLLQFARHLRNACAHGNRWHFTRGEPKHPAALRGRELEAPLHGTPAVMDWLGPGDYLDYLDDLASLMRRGPL